MKRFLFLLAFLPLFGYSQIKVSEMTAATFVNDADIFLMVQSGSSKKVSFSVFDYSENEAGAQIGDSLTDYRVEVANQIHDSIPVGSTVSIGTDGQVAYVNPTGTDLAYSSQLLWNGTSLTVNKGTGNLFLGDNSGSGNIIGISNMFLSGNSGFSNVSGNENLFLGFNSGYLNTTGSNNVFIGVRSGYENITGNGNSFFGSNSGENNTTSFNSFFGSNSGENTVSGENNLFAGAFSGFSNITGHSNVFLGYRTSYTGAGNIGNENVFCGAYSGYLNVNGDVNLFAGAYSGYSNSTGSANLFSGAYSGYENITGNENTYLGAYSGFSNTSGSNNVFIGFRAGQNETGSNKFYLSNSATDTLMYGEFDNDILHFNADLTIDGDIFADNLTSFSATQYQIPVVNVSGGGFDFSSNFSWNDTTFVINNGIDNVLIGEGSGVSMATGNSNTFIGKNSGNSETVGIRNVYIGDGSGESSIDKDNNTYIGYGAGGNNNGGDANTFVGANSGLNSSGGSNVFIGNSSGQNETGSNKFYLSNSATDTLMYGEFDNDILHFNADLTIDGTLTTNNPKFYAAFADSSEVIPMTQNMFSQIAGNGNDIFTVYRNVGDFTFQNDSLQIPITGWYEIEVSLSFEGSNSDVYNGVFYINNVAIENRGHFKRKTSNTDTGSANMVLNYHCTADDWVKIMIQNTGNDNDVTIINVDWYITYD